MAQRNAQRQKAAAPRGSSSLDGAGRVEPRTLDGWRAECERLRDELQAVQDENSSLRARQDQVLDRIDWVLDALDGLPEAES